MSNIDLNSKFKEALEVLNSSKHVFITGKAGTGKSTLLTFLRSKNKKNMAVLAPTGTAAINISGETIHSFFGFGPNITVADARKKARDKKNEKIYQNLDTLIIDEISMVRADLLDCIDVFLRRSRNSDSVFGGVQLIVIGDLYQLPPVLRTEDKPAFLENYESPYFFDSKAWQELSGINSFNFEFVELEKIYRQNDAEFIEILNSIRTNQASSTILNKLNLQLIDGRDTLAESIYLTATNKQADTINQLSLNKLSTESRVYEGYTEGEFNPRDLPTDENLRLKVGCRVMFLNNDTNGRWSNGTLGKIIDLHYDHVDVMLDGGQKVTAKAFTWTMYRSSYNSEIKSLETEEIGSFTQLPLKLAWAITIHKSQGKTFDNVVIDLGFGAFSHGQTYVALSRCTNIKNLFLKQRIKQSDIKTDERVINYMNMLTKK